MTEPRPPLTGSCLCRGVRYRIDGPFVASPLAAARPGPVANCHCSMCRKAQGAAFATNANVRTTDFRLLSGAELITEYESSPGKLRCFCRVCGSPIYSRRFEDPTTVRVRFGTLDDDARLVGVRASFHACAESAAPWFEITDDLPRFDSSGHALPKE